jgi:hypothetical protein
MAESSDDFGEWRTAPDGKAHYVISGRCLCGAKVKQWGGPPKRNTGSAPRAVAKYLTEFCNECMTQNYLRWARKGGRPTQVLSSHLDRRHRRPLRPWMHRAKKA